MDAPPELRDRIGDIIRNALSLEAPSHETDLIETGLLDSLALVTLIAEIEQDFGIELPLDDFDVNDFRTVERIARFVAANGGLP
jgi:D-alanine--poly(phosphoribitol) ligase subunit 2